MSELLDKKAVAARLKCSVSKVEKLMQAGTLRARKIGTLVRFEAETIDRFIEGTPLSPVRGQPRKAKNEVVENTRVYAPKRAGRE